MPSPSSMIPRPPSAPSTAPSNPYAMVRAVRLVRSTPRRSPSPREHLLQGFRNRELRRRLFGPCVPHDRWRSAQVSRFLKRLHLRGLLAKIPRSRRWRVTHLGHAVASTAVLLREEHSRPLSEGRRLTSPGISARYGEVGQETLSAGPPPKRRVGDH